MSQRKLKVGDRVRRLAPACAQARNNTYDGGPGTVTSIDAGGRSCIVLWDDTLWSSASRTFERMRDLTPDFPAKKTTKGR